MVGLLALMLLTDARRAARIRSDGSLVPLEEQDRERWNARYIAEGVALVTDALSRTPLGPYQLQAAIAALQEAARAEDTDWPQILALYELLERILTEPDGRRQPGRRGRHGAGPTGRPRPSWRSRPRSPGSPGIIAWMLSERISWRWPASARPLSPVTEARHAVRPASPNDATSRVERLGSKCSHRKQHDRVQNPSARESFRADEPHTGRGDRPPALGRQATGVRRFVAQINGAFTYARTGWAGEGRGRPAGPDAGREWRAMVAAIRHFEDAVLGADWTEGIVLRYGAFYGPGTSLAPGESSSSWSANAGFRWSATAAGCGLSSTSPTPAEATLAAVEHGRRGVYNVVDDDPAPVSEWLPALAQDASRQGADARSAVYRAAVRWGGRCGDDDRASRRFQCQGKARAGVVPSAPELAARVRGG